MTQDLSAVRWPVRTERLTIRPATTADVEPTWSYRRLPQVYEWVTKAPADLAAYAAIFNEPDRLAKTLVVELDGAVVADLMLSVEDSWAQAEVADRAVGVQAELGWSIDPAHGGRGYATEAMKALVRVCFEELGLRRVVANSFAANEPSWRLMERLGMRREQYAVQDSLHRSGVWFDGVMYALLADEWRATTRQ